MKEQLLFKREYKQVTSSKPYRVDTVSFDDATKKEMLDYFVELVGKYDDKIDTLKKQIKENEETRNKCTEDKITSLKREVLDKEAIIRYIEQRQPEYENDY